MRLLDEIVERMRGLDPRFNLERPECFLCGHKIRPEVMGRVQSGASPEMPIHLACAENMPAAELMARYWQAVRAAITGTVETPNPGPPRVWGGFR